MAEHMAVATLIALWMKQQSLPVAVERFRHSCSGSMSLAKKKVALKQELQMSMHLSFRFSPSIWRRAPNGMSLQFQDLLKELSLEQIHLTPITGLPMNAIFHLPCAATQISCRYFLGTPQQQMPLQRRLSMPLPKSALISRCAKRFVLVMLQ